MEQGLRVREYVPVGEMIPGMAYLVRRLLENTSNQSWLRAGFSAEVPDDVLLAAPPIQAGAVCPDSRSRLPRAAAEPASAFARRRRAGRRSADVQRAVARFLQEDQRQQFAQAVAEVNVPQVAAVGADACQKAIAAAAAAFPAWRDRAAVGPRRRSSCEPPPRCGDAAIDWPP